VAIDTLQDRMDAFARQGIEVHLAGAKGPVRDLLAKAGWNERYGARITHLSVRHALQALGVRLDAGGSDANGLHEDGSDVDGRDASVAGAAAGRDATP